MTSTYKHDYEFGKKKESESKPQIENELACKLTPFGQRMSLFDFYCKEKKLLIELKSRTNAYETFKTTLIGMNKVRAAKKLEATKQQVFFFINFTDGLYYIRYCEDMFDWIETYKRKTRSDYADYVAEYCMIPIKRLTKCKEILT